MNKRPICIACLCLMLLILIFRAVGVPVFGEPVLPSTVKKKLNEGAAVSVSGVIDSRQQKTSSVQYVIRNADVYFYGEHYEFERIKVTMTGETSVYMRQNRSLICAGNSYPYSSFTVGSRVTLAGTLTEISPPGNPGQFDSQRYFACQRIFYEMFCRRVILEEEKDGIKEQLTGLRSRMSQDLSSVMHPESAGVLAAMLMGDRTALDEETRLNYQSGGVMHVLAVSGLHISLLGMAVFGLILRILLVTCGMRHERIIQGVAAVASASLMGVYCLFTGSPVSAIRAWIMFAVLLAARVLRKSYDPLCSLGLAGILILCTSPGFLFYTGFQLSFAAVLGAAGVYPVLLKLIPVSFWRRGSRKKKIMHSLAEMSLCWCAVSLTTLPLCAWYFYQISILGLIANLLIVPAMSLVMEIGVVGSAALLFSKRLAWLILIPDDLLLRLFHFLTGALRSVPFAVWICGKPALWQMIAWYVGLMVMLLFLSRATGRSADRVRSELPMHETDAELPSDIFRSVSPAGAGRLAAPGNEQESEAGQLVRSYAPAKSHSVFQHGRMKALFILVLMCVLLFYRQKPAFSLTMLDAGQGDALVIRTGSRVFLVDGGSSSVDGMAKYRIVPYLQSQGISHVDGVFLTHGDSDHYSGIEEMLDAEAEGSGVISIGRMYMPYWLADENTGVRLIRECRNVNIPVSLLRQGDAVAAGKLRLDVIHPLKEGGVTEGNAGSLVLQVTYDHFSALLTGDLEGDGEKEILPLVTDVDYLKIGHHGSRYSTSEELLRAASPEICVISAPARSVYGHPHQETLDRIEAVGADAWCTKDCGAITVSMDRGDLHLRTFLNAKTDRQVLQNVPSYVHN